MVNLWIHGHGAVTQTHYDMAHNVLVQVLGKKRITLFPPQAHQCLHLFPYLHPRARKSQIPAYAFKDGMWLCPNFLNFIRNVTFGSKMEYSNIENQFPLFIRYLESGVCSIDSEMNMPWSPLRALSMRRPYSFELGPGDSLYIPPFWLHSVESIGTSLSINVFSASDEEDAFNKILFGTPLPFDDSWPSRLTSRAIIRYLDLIAVFLNLDMPIVARGILQTRYAQHRGDFHRGLNENEEGAPFTDIFSKAWLPWCREPTGDAIFKAKSEFSLKFNHSAKLKFQGIRGLNSTPLEMLVFSELVELSISNFFGATSVPLFLCACYSPVATREILHSSSRPRSSMTLGSCVRQWDMHVKSR
jgi:hypothetical protein